MSMRAAKDDWSIQNMLAPKAVSATTTSGALDTADGNANIVVVDPGLWTDGTHTLSVIESADNTTYTTVAAADLVGTLAVVSGTATAVVQKVGYIGKLRYLKVIDTVTAVTAGMVLGVLGLLRTKKLPAIP